MMNTDQDTSNASKKKEEQTLNDSKLNQENLIDGAFYVKQTRWKTWNSYDENNKVIITSLSEDSCIQSTRWYLKKKQEGFSNKDKIFSGTVDGKL